MRLAEGVIYYRFSLSFIPIVITTVGNDIPVDPLLIYGRSDELNTQYGNEKGHLRIYDLNGQIIYNQKVAFKIALL
ncbi:MAG: hypothetical protein AAFQ94_21720 [Bacteroidota bacterium]